MMLPVLTALCRRRKRPVDRSWPMDETYINVAGHWKVLCRAVDKTGATAVFSDMLLSQFFSLMHLKHACPNPEVVQLQGVLSGFLHQ